MGWNSILLGDILILEGKYKFIKEAILKICVSKMAAISKIFINSETENIHFVEDLMGFHFICTLSPFLSSLHHFLFISIWAD